MPSILPINRLHRPSDYSRVLSTGNKMVSVSWVFITSPGTTDVTRVGIIASKKVGKAVSRNRAKRLLRALSREVLAKDERLKDLDVVLIARSHLLRRDYQLLVRELKYCVAKINQPLQEQKIKTASCHGPSHISHN